MKDFEDLLSPEKRIVLYMFEKCPICNGNHLVKKGIVSKRGYDILEKMEKNGIVKSDILTHSVRKKLIANQIRVWNIWNKGIKNGEFPKRNIYGKPLCKRKEWLSRTESIRLGKVYSLTLAGCEEGMSLLKIKYSRPDIPNPFNVVWKGA